MGVSITDVGYAKLEYMLGSLVDQGILTDEQFWEMQLRWEDHFNDELMKAEVNVRENLKKAEQRSRLLLPTSIHEQRKA